MWLENKAVMYIQHKQVALYLEELDLIRTRSVSAFSGMGQLGHRRLTYFFAQNPVWKCKLLRNRPKTNLGVEKAVSGC